MKTLMILLTLTIMNISFAQIQQDEMDCGHSVAEVYSASLDQILIGKEAQGTSQI